MAPDPAQAVPSFLLKPLALFVQAFLPFLQQGSPLYWPFLVSTLVIAAVAWRLFAAGSATTRPSWREFRRDYLGGAIWWHPSARADYRFYLVNAVLFPLILGPALFTGVLLAGGIDALLRPMIGAAPSATPGIALRIFYTVVFFVAYDLGRFIAHSAQHDVPVLWEFHKVHHSAEVLTPLTAFRAHPVDLAIMSWGGAIATGIATWLFQRLFGVAISPYTFLELNVLVWGFNLLGNLKHWQVPISYGRWLDRWLISPAHHQLHHSAAPHHFGCNRGFEIALWDRLYGTLNLPKRGERVTFGLGDGSDGNWHRLWRLYLWSFALVARRLGGRAAAVDGDPIRPTG
jgi:sterol desaturase/sphingolipid hydroxylase (fatty acid hydroxylase superfamily)